MDHISKHTFDFLKKLASNNDREWFQAHKTEYEKSHQEMIAFADQLLERCNQHDLIETPTGKKSLMRIYRDVRFSKDKAPYKRHWGGGLRRAGASRRGGMYYHIQPGGSFIGGGFWGPSKEDLLHIRKQIQADAEPLREVLESKDFKTYFGELHGEQLKTAPKGFDKEDPNIDLLRYKQFLVSRSFPDEAVLKPGFVDQVADGFRRMLPFFEVMSEYLTTDLNGVSLLAED